MIILVTNLFSLGAEVQQIFVSADQRIQIICQYDEERIVTSRVEKNTPNGLLVCNERKEWNTLKEAFSRE